MDIKTSNQIKRYTKLRKNLNQFLGLGFGFSMFTAILSLGLFAGGIASMSAFVVSVFFALTSGLSIAISNAVISNKLTKLRLGHHNILDAFDVSENERQQYEKYVVNTKQDKPVRSSFFRSKVDAIQEPTDNNQMGM